MAQMRQGLAACDRRVRRGTGRITWRCWLRRPRRWGRRAEGLDALAEALAMLAKRAVSAAGKRSCIG